MPGPAIRFRLCGQAPLIRLQTSRRSAKYWAVVAGWPMLMTAAGSPGAQQPEEPVLQREQVIRGRGAFRSLGGSVEPGPAGAVVTAGVLRPEGCPALSGVQAGVEGARDQPGGRSECCGHGWLPAGRAQVFQQPPVRRAGEHDRQPPCLPPGAAVLLLDVAAVSAQALRAVPGRGGEHPRAGVAGQRLPS